MARLAPFGRLFPYLRPYRGRMAAAALLVMGAAGVNLSMLSVIRRLVDTVLVQRDAAALNTAIAELGALFLLQGLLIMGHSYLTASAGQRIMADFRTHLFDHLQGLSGVFRATADRRIDVAADERCGRAANRPDRDSDRPRETGRYAGRRARHPVRHELALVPADSAPPPGPRADRPLLRPATQGAFHRHSGRDRARLDDSGGGALRHPDRQVLRAGRLRARPVRLADSPHPGRRSQAGSHHGDLRAGDHLRHFRRRGGGPLVRRVPGHPWDDEPGGPDRVRALRPPADRHPRNPRTPLPPRQGRPRRAPWSDR